MATSPPGVRGELEKLERKHAEYPDGRYFVPLANAYRKGGDVSQAIELLRQGLKKHPDYLSAHIVLARCLADMGDHGAAVAEFRYVLAIDPQNLVALRTLGELASRAGNVEDARSWYSQLLAVDPMNEEARQAISELDAGPPGAGEQPLSGAVGEPRDAAGQQSPGSEGAVAAMEGETLYSGGDAVVTETIAELYTRQGFYDRAIGVYRELIRRRGGDSRLEGRIREVEALARGDVGDSPDPFADSFSEGFPGDGAERPGPRTIGEHLRAMLASGLTAVQVAEEGGDEPDSSTPHVYEDNSGRVFEEHEWVALEPAAGGGLAPESPPAGLSAVTAAAADHPAGAATEPRKMGHEPEPATPPASAPAQAPTSGSAPTPATGAAPPPPTPPAVEDDYLFPWEVPLEEDASGGGPGNAGEARRAEPTVSFEPPPRPLSAELPSTAGEGFGPELRRAEPARPDPTPAPPRASFDPSPPPAPGRESAPPGQPETPEPPPSNIDEDDDDLESFQAWLRSLKR